MTDLHNTMGLHRLTYASASCSEPIDLGRVQQEIRAIHILESASDGSSPSSWNFTDRQLSSDIAGETGAVTIYSGAILALSIHQKFYRLLSKNAQERLPPALDFVHRHRETEKDHLAAFQNVLPKAKRTKLLPMCYGMGLVLGFVPAIFGGPRALYHTIDVVETYVEEHYERQIKHLETLLHERAEDWRQLGMADCALILLLRSLQGDEVEHKTQAIDALLGMGSTRETFSWYTRLWRWMVRMACTGSVELTTRI